MKKLLLVLGVVGCLSLTEPDGAYSFDPPDIYRFWYRETAQCLGGTAASFDGIDWYLVPGDGWVSPNLHRPIVGAYYPSDEIFIAEDYRFQRSVVSHEMLHYLHSPKHPSPPFGVCDHP